MPTKKTTVRKSKPKKLKSTIDSKARADLLAEAVFEKKAEAPVIMNIEKLSGFADYFIVCHGVGGLHVSAIAENAINRGREKGMRPIGDEGMAEGRWVLVDFGDVVVHVFDREVRNLYNLEKLWMDADVVEYKGKK